MPDLPVQKVRKDDLQGNILCGYGNDFRHGLYLFVQIEDAGAGRKLVADLLERVTRAARWPGPPTEPEKPVDTLNLAMTWRGLGALGVPAWLLDTFPRAFRAGMAARAEILGDTGESDPDKWDPGLREGEPHLLITVTARSEPARDALREELLHRVAEPCLKALHQVSSRPLGPEKGNYAREHFGFADGLAQPSIRGEDQGPWGGPGQGIPTANPAGWRDIEPGEFILGYRDEDGGFPDAPADPLGCNGSYMVVRKLHQDVALFNWYLKQMAGGKPEREEEIAAKIVGRWRNGEPLIPSRTPDDERDPKKPQTWINNFRYADDPEGLRCPLGAHIRRANPREDFLLAPGGEFTMRHRIIRRGMPYGEPLADPLKDDGGERGLMFVCFQSKLEAQFEFIQQRWLLDGDAFRLGPDQDFLAGQERARGKMAIPGRRPDFLHPQHAFVVTKGGEYFFAPGIAALGAIAAGRFA
jgi:Dyp-type peroxidase family